MKALLADSNLVVVAHDVNLSIFRPPWLVKQGFMTEEELSGELVISPVVVRLPGKGFDLTVVPNRIQMAFPGPNPGATADIDRVLVGIVKTLPHTPYSACGLNINYIATVEEDRFRPWSEKAFASEAARRAGAAAADDARFGSYFSFDVLGGRLKLDMKPTRTSPGVASVSDDWAENTEVMRLNFNYHFEIAEQDERIAAVLEALGKWDDALEHAKATIDRLAE